MGHGFVAAGADSLDLYGAIPIHRLDAFPARIFLGYLGAQDIQIQ